MATGDPSNSSLNELKSFVKKKKKSLNELFYKKCLRELKP